MPTDESCQLDRADQIRPNQTQDRGIGAQTVQAERVCQDTSGRRCRQTFAFQTLIVDDDDLVRDVMHAQLAAVGIRAVPAASRTEAIEHLRRTTFDLVFLDTRLPDLTEADVLAEIPGIGETTTLALISGLDRPIPPGAMFLLKPVALADVRAVVSTAQDRADATLCNCEGSGS